MLRAEGRPAQVVAVEEPRQVVRLAPLLVDDLEPRRGGEPVARLEQPVAEIHVLRTGEARARPEARVEAAAREEDLPPADEVGRVADPGRVDDVLPHARLLDVEDADGQVRAIGREALGCMHLAEERVGAAELGDLRHERREPARGDLHVVVQEGHVLAAGEAGALVARGGGRRRPERHVAHPLVADQVEGAPRRVVLALVDDDDLERERLAAEDRLHDRSRAEGPVERRDDDRDRGLGVARGRHSSRARSAGKRMTSRIVSRPVRSIARRSMPSPSPPVGGIP